MFKLLLLVMFFPLIAMLFTAYFFTALIMGLFAVFFFTFLNPFSFGFIIMSLILWLAIGGFLYRAGNFINEKSSNPHLLKIIILLLVIIIIILI